ncbi:raffinose/stachyose/melibiose transport system substrate-binding protein [Paenibacillus sp. 1_12]|uniref:ABC transporter substrate-binding protein n=1 Tax=Paenibacillus sp. 1_12 TaxID=1566278 RepID=UPI0008EAB002|nr:ABC transporter substrate-binding protein [Paenibacillus sp. 1_12]SFM43510.1 raffinose/stachyose/melibiose transport system substrate-binding protein [Paenibacillus sp. 1_12]
MFKIINLMIALIIIAILSSCSHSPKAIENPNSSQQITLELLSNKMETTETLEKIIAKFQEQNPTYVIEQDAPPNMLKVLTMRFSTNTAPSLFMVYPSAPSIRHPIKNGYIEDLTGDLILSNVKPEFVEFSKTRGRNYAVPLALEGNGIIYNMDIFREQCLNIPQTYAELLATSEKLKLSGKTPFIFPDKDHTYVRRVSTVLLGLDNPDIIPYFEDVIAGKKHIIDSTPLVSMVNKTLELREYGQKDSLGTSNEAAIREFASGRVAMFFTGMWEINSIKKANPTMEIAMFPFPAERMEDTKVATQVGTAIGIPKNSKTMMESKKFLSFLASTEMAQLFSDETGNISVIKGVQHHVKENKGIAEYALAGKLFRAADSPWTPTMQDDFGKSVQQIIAGGGIDSFLKKMEELFYNMGN